MQDYRKITTVLFTQNKENIDIFYQNLLLFNKKKTIVTYYMPLPITTKVICNLNN